MHDLVNLTISPSNKLFKTEIRILLTVVGIAIFVDAHEKPFQHNEYTDSIIIEDSTETIPGGFKEGYFEYVTSLTNVKIPETVTTIGGRAFYSCSKLKEIRIPASVIIIESGTFDECSSLTEIIIPTTITFISDYLFQNCSSTNIAIPTTVRSIENYSFS